MAYPDPETVIRDWLRTNVFTASGDDRVRVEAGVGPTNTVGASRLVVVTEAPGAPGDAILTLDQADVVVDCYAANRERAKAIAEQVRSGLRGVAIVNHTTAGGAVVKQVLTLARPTPVPTDRQRLAKVSATYRIWFHATP